MQNRIGSFARGLLIAALAAMSPATPLAAAPANRAPFLPLIPELLQSAAQGRDGQRTIVVVIPETDAGKLFPTEAKNRVKSDIPAVLADGNRVYLGMIAAGGQSSLKVPIPNLRVSDLEELTGGSAGKGAAAELGGIPLIDGTLRLNPMTMDEGYINTLTYLELLRHFRLFPASRNELTGEYAKLVYRFVDAREQWTQALVPSLGSKTAAYPAGLHLVSFHPVKYLKELDSDTVKVLAVARSRYNILNRVDQVKRLFGRKTPDELSESFSSTDAKGANAEPFRVEIKWVKKTKAEKDGAVPDAKLENLVQLKALLVKAYSAPRRARGKALHDELNAVLDLEQWFRFMALNRLLENGDISDEFFWYLQEDRKTGQTRLGTMPQDGDDMFRGAHAFPFHPKQIALLVNSNSLARRLGLEYGYIMNYEDPLFRIVADDPYLFHRYLLVFERMAADLASGPTLDRLIGSVGSRLRPYAGDHDVLDRGRSDARGREYSPESFESNLRSLTTRVRGNAAKALASLRPARNRPGDLAKAAAAAD